MQLSIAANMNLVLKPHLPGVRSCKTKKALLSLSKYVVLRSMRSIADKDILSNPTKSVHRHDFVNFGGLSFSAETLGLL